MLAYFTRRFLYMILLMVLVSILSFVVIELPPGNYLTYYIQELSQRGATVDQARIAALKKQYGLDRPAVMRYISWIKGMFRGDFGRSLAFNRPVLQLIYERLPKTLIISLVTMLFTYIVSVPIGIYTAVKQYSVGDYIFAFIGFLGLAMPNFLLALILMYVINNYFGLSPTGLFSPEFSTAAWSYVKFIDLLKHLPVPVIVIGTAGTARLIRILRGTLLDELQKQYVTTARSKGVSEIRLLFKYPVRLALNPIVSTIGWVLPAIFSGAAITSIVLNLPTIGQTLYQALLSQDTYLAGAIVMILGFLTVIGTFVSDILLAWIDPRIQYQ